MLRSKDNVQGFVLKTSVHIHTGANHQRLWLHATCLLLFVRFCSYLPLAHIYERNNMTVAVHLGGSVGFYSGNVQELLDDVLVRDAMGTTHSKPAVQRGVCTGLG